MNFIPYISTWSVLALVVLAIGVYRITLARRDDRSLDLMVQDEHVIADQKQAVKRIKTIDHWGQALTILTVLYGLAIAFVYFYQVWQEATRIPGR
ncbi:MAG TPA: hypothetical protein VG028_17390 [Terriglobia bacterium]|nr:hypothetical protein [Terriglobia bacterium]